LALTFQKGQGDKIFITKLTRNGSKVIKALTSNGVEYYTGYLTYTLLEDGTLSVRATDVNDLPEHLFIPSIVNGKYVTKIEDHGFKNANIKSVVFEGDIIGAYAFYNCKNLRYINKENYFSFNEIGKYAFKGCALDRIFLSGSIEKIGSGALSQSGRDYVFYEMGAEEWEGVECDDTFSVYFYSEEEPTATGNYFYLANGYEGSGVPTIWGSYCDTNGHSFSKDYVAPTCTEKGFYKYLCPECGDSYIKYESETGHTWQEATCTTPKTCSVCGVTRGKARGHIWSDWEITKRQNCTEAGKKTRACSVCGEQEDTTCGTAIGHDYEGGVLVLPPTCTEVGYIEQQCSRCESTHKKEVNPVGHDWGDWLTDETTGQTTSTCKRCGAVAIIQDFIFTELPDGNYSVKMKEGISGEIEIPSDYYGGKITEIEQSGFANSEIVSVIIPPSVIKIGDDAFNGCKKLKTITMNEGVTHIGHRAFKDCPSIERMCFPDSVQYIGHQTLNGCSGIATLILPYIGNFDWKNENHFYEYPLGYHFGTEYYNGGISTLQEYYNFWDINDPGTKLEAKYFYIPKGLRTVEVHRGNILHGAFQNCKYITKITLPTQIDKIGKNSFLNCKNLEELIIPVSLEEIDYSAFQGCSNVIIQYYGDETKYRIENNCLVEVLEDGTEEVIFGNQNSEIPSTASSVGSGAFYGNTYFAPIKIPLSVTSIGSLAFGGEPVTVYVERTSKPKGWAADWCDDSVTVVWGSTGADCTEHSWSLWETTTMPTCMAKGVDTRRCEVCGIIQTRFVDALSHKWKAPTCTSPQTCIFCGATVGEALGHDWSLPVIIKPATCLTKGKQEVTCSRCLTKEIQLIPATGHDYKSVVTPPTCTEQGYTEHTCSKCVDKYVDSYTDALGHDWSLPVIIKPATCEEDGLRRKTCKVCGHILEEAIPRLGGEHEFVCVDTPPTCTAKGYSTYTCTRCGDSYVSDPVAALGHISSDWIIDKEATGIAEGSKHKECTRCGEILETATIPKVENADEYLTYTLLDSGEGYSVKATNIENLPDELVIPSTYNGKPVLVIDTYAFYTDQTNPSKSAKFSKVTLPDTLEVISRWSFNDCENLVEINIPASVTTIDMEAFCDCPNLTEIHIPIGVEYIGDGAFYGNTNLTIYCEASSQPDTWEENWNYSNCNVVWGAFPTLDNNTYLVTESGEYLTDEQGNLLIL
jgi:hypothetical protein